MIFETPYHISNRNDPTVYTSVLFSIQVYLHFYLVRTREIPAFGGISLALRGSGANGAHLPPPSLARLLGGPF